MGATDEISVGTVDGVVLMQFGKKLYCLMPEDARWCRQLLKQAIHAAEEAA
jgi:hypothetical protein